MDLAKFSEKLMAMNDAQWQRHANPWSVWSRFTVLPLLSLAVASRLVLGLYALLPCALCLLWVWLNPRLFGAPKTTNNWASMGTFGERVYLNRANVAIPAHHQRAAIVLQTLSVLGLPVYVYGLYSLDWPTLILGNLWVMVFKAWFVDRMVWLYQDMQAHDPGYRQWQRE